MEKFIIISFLVYTLWSIPYLGYASCYDFNVNKHFINFIIGFVFGALLALCVSFNYSIIIMLLLSLIIGASFGIIFMLVLYRKSNVNKSYTFDELLTMKGIVKQKINDNLYLCTLYDEDDSDIIVFFKENININDTFKIKSIENNNIYGEKIIINN